MYIFQRFYPVSIARTFIEALSYAQEVPTGRAVFAGSLELSDFDVGEASRLWWKIRS